MCNGETCKIRWWWWWWWWVYYMNDLMKSVSSQKDDKSKLKYIHFTLFNNEHKIKFTFKMKSINFLVYTHHNAIQQLNSEIYIYSCFVII